MENLKSIGFVNTSKPIEKIEYWITSFETKVNLADKFLSELTIKYVKNPKSRDPENIKNTVELTRHIYECQQVLAMFKLIFSRAELENRSLVNRLNQANEKIRQYESDESGLSEIVIQEANKNLDKTKEDKYQEEIQRLELKLDQYEKLLIKYTNS